MADLDVFVHGQLAGRITGGVAGRASFAYDSAYLAAARTPLSLSVPLSHGAHEAGQWIDGLLPDNPRVREAWAIRNDAASPAPIDLLATDVGHDCAGAVQFVPTGEGLPQRPSGVSALSEHDIAAWVRQARRDWGTWGAQSMFGQFSLGGAQAKCALSRRGDNWGMPYGELPTTHILKPGLDHYRDAEAVEHVCLTAARRLGLDAAHTELVRFEDERVVAVTRFDRYRPARGEQHRRIHQEDLCQALGVAPDRKYQSDGGPSPAHVADLLWAESSEPARDVARFRDALIYNWTIAAPDAHAKNYSVFLDLSRVDLAPMYDVISYLPYAEGRPVGKLRTAMRIGDDYTLRKADRRSAWQRTADALRLDPDETVERAEDILRRTPAAVSDAIDSLPHADRASPVLPDLNRSISRRSAETLRELARQRSGPPRTEPTRPTDPTQPRAVLCDAETATGTCRRRLVNRPCPLHPASPGSQTIRERIAERRPAELMHNDGPR